MLNVERIGLDDGDEESHGPETYHFGVQLLELSILLLRAAEAVVSHDGRSNWLYEVDERTAARLNVLSSG